MKKMRHNTVVNFINILCANFLYECCLGSFFYIHVTREKLLKQCWYKKFVRKMLMQLTLGLKLQLVLLFDEKVFLCLTIRILVQHSQALGKKDINL